MGKKCALVFQLIKETKLAYVKKKNQQIPVHFLRNMQIDEMILMASTPSKDYVSILPVLWIISENISPHL